MGRWSGVGNGKYFGPEIETYELINEYDDGTLYKEMDYILLEDVPDIYRDAFHQWLIENNLLFCICEKISTLDGAVVNHEQTMAIDYSYWWIWYRVYGIKIE